MEIDAHNLNERNKISMDDAEVEPKNPKVD